MMLWVYLEIETLAYAQRTWLQEQEQEQKQEQEQEQEHRTDLIPLKVWSRQA
jgi:hypothetical protein